MRLSTRTAGTVAALALSVSVLATPALAAQPDASSKPEPCAQQQKQADKAEAALERLTARLEAKQAEVAKEKKAKKNADTAAEHRSAKADLAQAKDDRTEAKKDKKAQQQRVAKANERLEKCQAEQAATPAAG